jgi:hypothetical protein
MLAELFRALVVSGHKSKKSGDATQVIDGCGVFIGMVYPVGLHDLCQTILCFE